MSTDPWVSMIEPDEPGRAASRSPADIARRTAGVSICESWWVFDPITSRGRGQQPEVAVEVGEAKGEVGGR